jgi:hypothetical protein
LREVHGTAGGSGEQVAGAAEHVPDALLVDGVGEAGLVRRPTVVGENAGPIHAQDTLEDFGTAL